MLPEEIKHYILTLKHSHEMYDVIHHPLKIALNHEIQNYGLVMNEIQYRQSLPHVKNITMRFGFFQRKNKMKYRKPIFVSPFYSKHGCYWYYCIEIFIVYSN